MNELKLFDQVTKTDVLSTVFDDGMIVNAGDLDTAMLYPLDMFRTLVRAYFGCGVVCGLELTKYPQGDADTWCLEVHPGTALDCNANPLKLCERVIVSLKPDPCSYEEWPDCVCIAIRRETLPEGARTDGDCDRKSGYRRLRETVRVKAFRCDDLPKEICMRPDQDDDPNDENARDSRCECLTKCGACECCEDSWVLLGCVSLSECGIGPIDDSKRKYVKPIECLCAPSNMSAQLVRGDLRAQKADATAAAPARKKPAKRKRAKKKSR
jgi:hypothetical protein